ncbi:MAG: hypothetical protein ACPGIC_07795, partial [Opitutales bacterium]
LSYAGHGSGTDSLHDAFRNDFVDPLPILSARAMRQAGSLILRKRPAGAGPNLPFSAPLRPYASIRVIVAFTVAR